MVKGRLRIQYIKRSAVIRLEMESVVYDPIIHQAEIIICPLLANYDVVVVSV